MNTQKTEENRKQKLLKQIEQQRQTLGLLKADWLRITSPVDRGWQSLYQWRNVIVPAVGVAALYTLKSRPRRLIVWPRRVLAVWGGLRFIRRRFPSLR
ncbi:TPA: hypothetical protein J1422_003420 [Escherichia coli]|nr:hypothetical protein [Escherichia coli]EFO3928764.1 hypothetical protein [Escherichia coli]EKI3092421.1 YqjK-like family protein [Escherichia coli]HAZ3854750.1 hypothetical protein [Escherichia coli]HAZ3921107.1 hypothetical protein [Escherichia coli]